MYYCISHKVCSLLTLIVYCSVMYQQIFYCPCDILCVISACLCIHIADDIIVVLHVRIPGYNNVAKCFTRNGVRFYLQKMGHVCMQI